MNENKTDVLVIGAGAAGLRAAIEIAATGLHVIVAIKGRRGKCGATLTAGAEVDIDSASATSLLRLSGDLRDDASLFANDMLSVGEWINNVNLVDVHVAEAPQRAKELTDWGAKTFGLIHSPGHRYPRGVVFSGIGIVRALLKKTREFSDIEFAEEILVTDLIIDQGVIRGAVGLNFATGEVVNFWAKAVVIATGGCQSLYKFSDAPSELTGDGYGMAFRAGATFVDMEFIQFLICTMLYEPFTITPVQQLLYKGAWLLNSKNERFMKLYDTLNLEKSTRDVIARAIMSEVIQGRGTHNGCVYLSIEHLTESEINAIADVYRKGTFATSYAYDLAFFDRLKHEPIEVFPAAHYFCGGIEISNKCMTSVVGLFAAGEATGGTHGANRLAGNALSEALVQGRVAGSSAARFALDVSFEDLPRDTVSRLERKIDLIDSHRTTDQSPVQIRKLLNELSWRHLGVLRHKGGLQELLSFIDRATMQIQNLELRNRSHSYNQEWIEALQLPNLVLTAKIVSTTALFREESRGTHFRTDFPNKDERWHGCIRVLPTSREEMNLDFKPALTHSVVTSP